MTRVHHASYRSLDRGRRAEQDVAARLTRWAAPVYRFTRRGLGHAGVADLVVASAPSVPVWPFTISVKSARPRWAASVPALLARADAGEQWSPWAELEGPPGPEQAARRAAAWLIWRVRRGPWLLSCSTLGGLAMPPRLVIAPTPAAGWPRFTMLLDAALAALPLDQVLAALADGWGRPDTPQRPRALDLE